jgi:hypothetical protein
MLMVGKILESFQRMVVAKSKPQREQKKLASSLLARLYTKVGPITGVGSSSRKMDPFERIVRLHVWVARKS